MPWNRNFKSKFGAKRVSHAGYSFASQLEAALYDVLKLRQLAGEIKEIQTQASVYLTDARILFKPDFLYVMADGSLEYAEAKGFETSDYRIKRRLWAHYGPAPLHVYKGSAKRLYLDETIIPKVKTA